MEIIEIESGPVATKGYLVIDEETKRAAIIDVPLASTGRFVDLIEKKELKLEFIFLTHTHWDHVADASKLQEITKVDVYVHHSDGYRLKNPMEHTLMPLPFNIEPVSNFALFNNHETFNIGNINFEVVFTPGHTEGGICLIEHKQGVVFSGDTIFEGSIGRCDLPGGDYDLLIDSINNNLLNLPGYYKIYCGHGNPTTIEREKKYNPFLN